IVDGAANGAAPAVAADGLVASEEAARDGQGPAIQSSDRPACAGVAYGLTEGFVVGQDIVSERQATVYVQDTSPLPAGRPTIFDPQAGDRDGDRFLVLTNVKAPAGVVAADGQQAGARALDVQALANRQVAACQGDRLAAQAGGEDDRVPAAGGLDRRPQRACP